MDMDWLAITIIGSVVAAHIGVWMGRRAAQRRVRAWWVQHERAAWEAWARSLGWEGQGGGGGGSIGEPGPIAAVGEKVHTRIDTPQKIPKKIPG